MLDDIIQTVKFVAQREIVPRYLRVAHEHKVDGSLCTIADTETQAELVRRLRKIAPYPVIGEEMPPDVQRKLWEAGKEGVWVIDPIDGTSNFVNGLPYFAVSIALMRQGRTEIGVIYAPEADEMFWAEKGKGAYLNGESLPIKERLPKTLKGAMAGVDLKRLNKHLAGELASHPPYRSQRNFGSSALDWCYAAAGRFDVYLHGGQKLWDYAAGILIFEEAGGHVCTLHADDFWADDLWTRSVIAALSPDLFETWKSWIKTRL
jgi:myo-inositol-1(or 4)-monophosphatase